VSFVKVLKSGNGNCQICSFSKIFFLLLVLLPRQIKTLRNKYPQKGGKAENLQEKGQNMADVEYYWLRAGTAELEMATEWQ
jgi:hypothetical protein